MAPLVTEGAHAAVKYNKASLRDLLEASQPLRQKQICASAVRASIEKTVACQTHPCNFSFDKTLVIADIFKLRKQTPAMTGDTKGW